MTSPDQMEAGPRAAAISNMMVRLLREYTGRGPTRARTTIGDDLIVCLLADTLTTSERRLVDAGEERLVLEERGTFQRLMREKAIAGVERLSGRSVTAFMSTNHIDPDLAVEAFVLAPSHVEAPGDPDARQAGWPA
jgi:uncharacterized protein YbcI